MPDFDLDQPALVLWVPQILSQPNNTYQRGDTRQFGSVRKAIQFVMELPLEIRSTASIETNKGPLTFEQIEKLHSAHLP
jgi:hypothetical protein